MASIFILLRNDFPNSSDRGADEIDIVWKIETVIVDPLEFRIEHFESIESIRVERLRIVNGTFRRRGG